MNEPNKKVKHFVVCKHCDGDGTIPDFTRPRGPFFFGRDCPTCKGKGWVEKGVPHVEDVQERRPR